MPDADPAPVRGTVHEGTSHMFGSDRGDRTKPSAPATPPVTPAVEPTPDGTGEAERVPHAPRTRVGSAWFAVSAVTLVSVVLIVFMLQNTRSTEISFLGWHGTLPLALALLIAAVGAAIVTVAIGTARITQLRRFSARQTAPASR